MVRAGVRIGPLVGRKAAHVEEDQTDAGEGGEEVHPHDGTEGREKGPETGLLDDGPLEEDGDAR